MSFVNEDLARISEEFNAQKQKLSTRYMGRIQQLQEVTLVENYYMKAKEYYTAEELKELLNSATPNKEVRDKIL